MDECCFCGVMCSEAVLCVCKKMIVGDVCKQLVLYDSFEDLGNDGDE